ncbi:MAG TPA: TIGR03667 family PPOX class F420-dependent oxidoreductase [Cellulomonas sp.]
MTIPDTPLGARVRTRLRDEQLVWLTTVAEDGTPQPNPVWFLWDGADSVIVYNDNRARRLGRLTAGGRVSLNFQAGAGGGDVVVLTGTAAHAPDVPAPADNADYLAKYADGIAALGGPAIFAGRYDVPVRIRIEHVRGF